MMFVTMCSHLVAGSADAIKQIRMRYGTPPQWKKGCLSGVLGKQVQEQRRRIRAGTIIETQHEGLGPRAESLQPTYVADPLQHRREVPCRGG